MRVNSRDLLGILWTLTAVSILLSAGRYYIHYTLLKRLRASDGFHILALVMLLCLSICYTLLFPLMDKMTSLNPDATMTDAEMFKYMQISLASSIIWLTNIYAVKFSFLFFYRALFGVKKSFMISWWIVMALMVVSFWTSIGATLASCGGSAANVLNQAVCSQPSSVTLEAKMILLYAVLNIITDAIVVVLPLWQLGDLQITLKQKLGLGLLFSLAAVILTFNIACAVVSEVGTDPSQDIYTTSLFDILAVEVAVIVSTLVAYRTLYGNHQKSRRSKLYYNSSSGAPQSFDKPTKLRPLTHQRQRAYGELSDGDNIELCSKSAVRVEESSVGERSADAPLDFHGSRDSVSEHTARGRIEGVSWLEGDTERGERRLG